MTLSRKLPSTVVNSRRNTLTLLRLIALYDVNIFGA